MTRSRRTTTKNDLARQIAPECGITIAQAEKVIDLIVAGICRAVTAGNRVEFRKFGVFQSRRRKERLCGPLNGNERLYQRATTGMVFKAARHMADLMGE